MLIVGCGYVGSRLAQAYASKGAAISAVVGCEASARRLLESGIPTAIWNLDKSNRPELGTAQENIFYLVPPPGDGVVDTRMQHFLAALKLQVPPKRIVLISTTGVYGDCQGGWVEENHQTAPTTPRSRRRLDAENQLRCYCDANACEWVIARVAGIYGPDRLPLERLRAGTPMVSASEAPWTNRIHVDDLVQVLMAAMEKDCSSEIFNVSDGTPGNMREYFDWIADLAGLPRAPQIDLANAGERLSQGMLSYLRESRRIDNHKMLEQLQIQLNYPTLEGGLRASLALPAA